jgi:hypothetical protein
MGSSSSSNADISTLKSQVTTLQNKLSNYDRVSTAALNPSTNVTVDYDALGTKLVTTSDNLSKIRDSLINSGTKLSDAVVPAMASNEAIKTAIRSSITANTDFANSVAGLLTSNDTYKAKLKGDPGTPGSIGDYTAVKSNLHSSTLNGAKHGATIWCGDGEICQLPQGTNGIQIGGWTIQEEGDQLVFKRGNVDTGDNKPHLRMAADGNFWVSRSTSRGWVADMIGDKQNQLNNKINVNDTIWLRNPKQGNYLGWADWGQNGGCLNISGYKCDIPKIGGGRGEWEKFVIER